MLTQSANQRQFKMMHRSQVCWQCIQNNRLTIQLPTQCMLNLDAHDLEAHVADQHGTIAGICHIQKVQHQLLQLANKLQSVRYLM